MKIIVAIANAPYPVLRGTDRLIMDLIRGLSQRHEVILVTMVREREHITVLKEIEGPNLYFRAIVAPNRRSMFHRLFYKLKNCVLSVVRLIPIQVFYVAPESFLRLIAETAQDGKADLVIASYWHLYNLPGKLGGIRNVLVVHDIDLLVHPERLRRISGRVQRFVAAIEARMRERIEREAYRRYESILALTGKDAEALSGLREMNGKEIFTLPLALDLDEYRPDAFTRQSGRILLLGIFSADFNRDALLYFMRDVFPLVMANRPDAKLEVVGPGVDRNVRGEVGPGVRFTGSVEEVQPYLGRCTLMVLPLRFGGGVRIRMLEAAAMGTPVVSTPVGVAGMGLTDGVNYIEASTPAGFAEAVIRLLEDSDLAREIGKNARKWAEANISMEDYPDRLDELLSALCRRSSKNLM